MRVMICRNKGVDLCICLAFNALYSKESDVLCIFAATKNDKINLILIVSVAII